MARPTPTVNLPVIQNWSCHNCGGCCREHLIEISTDEKQRIEQQHWTPADGLPADRPAIVQLSADRFRLNHLDDGGCIFLNEQGLCRIHAKFGEAAKPLACRVYPYAFHPDADQVTVSLRFSCPSVVQNIGRPVLDQQSELRQIAQLVTGPDRLRRPFPPPRIHGQEQPDWPDFHRWIDALQQALTDTGVGFATRLLRVLSWMELVDQSRFDLVRGARLDDYLQTLQEIARRAQPDDDLPIRRPSRIARVMFRQLIAQLLRHDTQLTVRGGWITRLKLLTSVARFTTGFTDVPDVPDPVSVARVFSRRRSPSAESSDRTQRIRVRFCNLEEPGDGRTPEIDELMTRYFLVKIRGLHFCGPANFGSSLTDGFRMLALMYPAALYLARLRARRAGESRVTISDVQASLATIDHNFAYAPLVSGPSAVRRIRILTRMRQIPFLCGWYSR